MKITELNMISSQSKFRLIVGLMINIMGVFAIFNMWILS
jgi:hypothetical protein